MINKTQQFQYHSTSEIPLSLYVHFPWCIKKCPYCDFNSHQLDNNFNEINYIDALIADFDADIKLFSEKRELTSIFLGGGTPSIFSASAIERLLQHVSSRLTFAKNIEITLEANPGTADITNFKNYLSAGVNRLSIGVQSLNDNHLKQLGRIHDRQAAIRAVKFAQDIGFDNINVDIMFALPNQTINEAVSDINQALALQTNHLSYYQLTIEANTAFYNNPPPQLQDEGIYQLTQATYPLLMANSFKQYEISAWTKNLPSQHNLNYWQYGDYLGIGAGAHGKITVNKAVNNEQNCGKKTEQLIIRSAKYRHPNKYLSVKNIQSQNLTNVLIQSNINQATINLADATAFSQEIRLVTEADKAFEFMLNALRLKSGFNAELITQRGLFNIENQNGNNNAWQTLNKLIANELIIYDKTTNIITPTAQGFNFLNDLISEFLNTK